MPAPCTPSSTAAVPATTAATPSTHRSSATNWVGTRPTPTSATAWPRPVEHREHAVDDFSPDDYAALQRVVHAVGRALTATIDTERLYVLSLGSQQGNRHVHWHLVPLPPGVPYDQQQTALFDEDRGWLHTAPADQAKLADQIRAALASWSQSRQLGQILGR
jgi:diadenosine tetraphosphate (Ap4A) HIT family hydrolase